MRLVPFCVSTFGAIGETGQRFISELSRLAGSAVPVTLLGCATWATPRFGPMARMALTTALRRGYAEMLCRHWRRAPRADVPHHVPPHAGSDADADAHDDDDDDVLPPLYAVPALPALGAGGVGGAGAVEAVAAAMWG